ncbi:hypothetical protein ACW9I6_02465 [Pseudomonas sp. SDO5522_S412]|uniref:hypothetical protein n=1 Tax=Pseudomonas sp. P7779 TaxID=2738832 RepID=UPI0015C1135F|nr:hypothetical protein [Pseudomonas sp. P7779]NWD01309.1 hypothetical protein [Pseudomonas sp. P7779]
MNIAEQLQKLSKERSQKPQFKSLEEFEVWSDAVRPLISFNKKYLTEFTQAVTNATVLYRTGNLVDATTNMNNAVGIANQATTLAKLESAAKKPEITDLTPQKTESKSLKEKFENHVVIFGSTLAILGFAAGISSMKFIFSSANQTSSAPQTISFDCKIDGLPILAESHDKRVASLQNKIMEFEAQASDRMLISPYQEKYLESANRVRRDIDIENSLYDKSIERLLSKCKETSAKN